MDTDSIIDVSFDFRSDTPGFPRKDPDVVSPTLRRYHKHLWSKELPCGGVFVLSEAKGHYLHHESALGEFSLASDSVIPTFARRARMAHIIERIPAEEREAFQRIGYTIGGMMLFPAERVHGKMTINGARGFHPRINDRFDLTVECIRRYYSGEPSPLSEVLARYTAFFALFWDFRGFIDFFLLQDIVNANYSAVDMFTPFADFSSSPLPSDLDAYLLYRERAIRFINARNRRIAATLAPECGNPSASDAAPPQPSELMQPDTVSAFPEDIRAFVDRERWTFAKTMPKWPHEYLVRKQVDNDLFERTAIHIRSRGYVGRFYNKPITYFDDRGRVYWTMGAPIAETIIINRCLKEDSYEAREKAGKLPE